MRYAIFQLGHGVLAVGHTLAEAHEKAVAEFTGVPEVDGIECYDATDWPVRGHLYWSCNPDTIERL